MRTARVLFWALAVGLAASAPARADADPKADALKLNKDVTGPDAANAKLKELAKDKDATAKLVTAAADLQKAAKDGEKPFRFYAALVLAKSAVRVKDYDAADLFFTFCTDNAVNDLQQGRLIALAAQEQIVFLTARKKHDKVQELCQKMLEIDGDRTLSQMQTFFTERLLLSIVRQGNADEAMDKADKLIKQTDGNPFMTHLKAQLQREAGKLGDAVGTYKKVIADVEALDRLPKEAKEEVLRQFKYELSGVYLDNDQFDESVKLLEELLKANPDMATFHNDLGFLLADHDKRLDEAEKMIRKAIELDLAQKKEAAEKKLIDPAEAAKPNPAYTDSLGWVLYKNKKYEEALTHLLEAAKDEDDGGHIEIWDHVGDCQLALGKKAEALATYQKALRMDDVSKKDADRRKKVTEKIKKLKAELGK
jgi:tetratricopeptide (TPR) repeat protein